VRGVILRLDRPERHNGAVNHHANVLALHGFFRQAPRFWRAAVTVNVFIKSF
jgi:hypothetical protein